MAVGYNPRAITDGLVLALDAGNPKNYNAGISTNWTDKVGGNNGTLVGGTHHNDGPFVGAGYVEFDGTGDYLSITDSTDFDFGSGDFTIEFFLYSASFSDYTGILGKRNAETDYAPLLIDTDNSAQKKMRFLTSTTGSSWISITSSSAFPLSQWVHVAVVRSGSTITLYENGVSKGSASISGSIISNSVPVFVGAGVLTISGSARLNGFLSNVRIVKGTALYTSNFTPPTRTLTAVTNTTLLTCQGNTIADASSSAHTITANGDAVARLGYPASAFVFDGSNDYVLTSSNTEVGFGTGDFTIEAWFYSNQNQDLFAALVSLNNGSGGNDWQFEASGSKISVRTLFTPTTTYTHNAWHQASWVRQGSSNYLFLDGVQIGTFTDSTDWDYGTLNVGSNRAYNNLFNGKISAVKIYKGKGLTAAEVQQNYNATKGRYA